MKKGKGRAGAVKRSGAEKRQEKRMRQGLLPLLTQLEGERAILTVPLGEGKGDGGDA